MCSWAYAVFVCYIAPRDCNPGPFSQSRDSGLALTGSRDPGIPEHNQGWQNGF
jgi:hypothetical protein